MIPFMMLFVNKNWGVRFCCFVFSLAPLLVTRVTRFREILDDD